MGKVLGSIGALVAALAVSAGTAYAISHVNDYRTNLQNYRVCATDELATCEFDEVVSPSRYHLENSATVTVIYDDDGDVQLRIDSNTIRLDRDISYTCSNQLYECNASGTACLNLPAGAPNNSCAKDRCWGGSNAGASCTVHSMCPGGTCTGSNNCYKQTCQDGGRIGTYCGAGGTECTSTNGYTGFQLLFTGNQSGGHFVYPNVKYLLRGDGSTGCAMTCTFALGADGSVNTSDLSGCVQTGDCTGAPLESLHNVWLLDPDGEILAVPGIGPATYSVTTHDGDPVKDGDCTRVPGQAPCL